MGISGLILQPDQFEGFLPQVGAKTLNLKKLLKAGYSVPRFVAVPCQSCGGLFSSDGFIDKQLLNDLVQELQKTLPVQSYAVRSSALIEDNAKSSLAGQFITELNIGGDQLGAALQRVLHHAYKYLDGNIQQFSLLIQEYIEPDYAGVLFTRDPQGGRETVLEYHKGRGEELVSGKIKPITLRFFKDHAPSILDLPEFEKEIYKFMELEKLFGFAQDIEWCVKGNIWFYLQARPLTTLSKVQYQQNIYLDEILPKNTDFFYEKNEIAEIAPAPTPFTWSLLEKIYDVDGPVARVYKQYGVQYLPYQGKAFLVKIGNELFVDKENELQTLLPSYSYFGRGDFIPHFSGWHGLGTTLKNIFSLQKISFNHEGIFKVTQQKLLTKESPDGNFQKLLQAFLNDYELIFEINLLADKAVKKLARAIVHEPISIAELLNAEFPFVVKEDFRVHDALLMKGNALEISQEEPFINKMVQALPQPKVVQWWKNLVAWKQTYYQKIITPAIRYSHLREYGRWLTVKGISLLREDILEEAKEFHFQDVRNIYFATINEIVHGKINEGELIKRKLTYQQLSVYTFPARLTSKPSQKTSVLQGVSAGSVTGILVGIDQIEQYKDVILYTKMLTPDLTQYFDKIIGIVSEEGGLLSHLAIMAREHGIPVIVGFNLQKSGIHLSDTITIDGGEGTIIPLKL